MDRNASAGHVWGAGKSQAGSVGRELMGNREPNGTEHNL